MQIDWSPYFKKYQALVQAADEVFERVSRDYPAEVTCRLKCADCCHALFDITLVEAIYINHHFNARYTGEARDQMLESANRADREIYRLKRQAYKALQAGQDESEILMAMGKERVRCPLLNADDQCDMYARRPITCRLYGIPASVGGVGRTCRLSGFEDGQSYPTVNLDVIQKQLYQISLELVHGIGSQHIKMAEMLVPVSMAILNDYDEDYLGLPGACSVEQQERKSHGQNATR